MSDTAARLQAYKDAELRTLDAQRFRRGDRERQNADLVEIRKAIRELEAQLASEQAAAAGQFGPRVLFADFSQGFE